MCGTSEPYSVWTEESTTYKITCVLLVQVINLLELLRHALIRGQ